MDDSRLGQERNKMNMEYFAIPERKWKSLSHVWPFATQWAIQPMEFSRPESWSV